MNDKKLVVKSNHLIESRYKLPVIAQKVLLGCAMKVRSTDDFYNTLYTLSVDEYVQYFGVNSNGSYENLREAVDVLWNSSFYILDKDGVPIEHRWITSRKRDKRNNYVGVVFHANIKEFIYQLTEQFTSYKIENIAQLKSQYSIRLYELMKQYEKIGWRKIDYQELRMILSIGDGEYILFGDFNRRILKQAQKEIKENTDIDFEYTKLKDGRKVTGIKFTINKQKIRREQQLPSFEDKHFSHHELYDELIKYGCSPSEAEKYIKTHPKELIERNLKYCISEDEKGNVENKRGYFKSSLERDFAFLDIPPTPEELKEIEDHSTNAVNQELLDRLIQFGVPKRKAISELKKDEQRVRMALDAAIAYIEKQGDNIHNIAGVVNRAITDGWGVKSPVEIEAEEKKQALIKARTEKEKNEKELEKLKQKFDEQRKCEALKIFNGLSEQKKETVLAEVEQRVPKIMKSFFKKSGIESPFIMIGTFIPYMSEHYFSEDLQDFDKWAENRQ